VKIENYLAVALAALLSVSCGKSSPPPAAPAAPTLDDILPKHAQPKLPTMKIVLCVARDNSFRPIEALNAELALTEKEEMAGMMFRTNIQDSDSMLFVLPQPQQASFWMKNCPESISAAYISPDGVIQEIHHLERNDTNTVSSASANIGYVLEVNDGWFQRHNVSTGMLIRTEVGSLQQTFFQK